MTVLRLDAVEAGYGQAKVLNGVGFSLAKGGCLALLGRNGMGKTTTIRAIMGQLPLMSGTIERFGDSRPRPAHAVAAGGIGLVPEGRQIFTNLSVRENLMTFRRPPPPSSAATGGAQASAQASAHGESSGLVDRPWTLEGVLELLPRLAERLDHGGGQLSGGEQQMLAIGRALMTNPRLLVLDEATEGLAPIVRRQIWDCLAKIRRRGLSILVVDKNIRDLAAIADRFCVLEKGRVAWEGSPGDLMGDAELQRRCLGV